VVDDIIEKKSRKKKHTDFQEISFPSSGNGNTIPDHPFFEQTVLKGDGELINAFCECSTDCILVCDQDYNNLYANQAAIDHVKTSRDKVVGKTIRDGLGLVPDFMRLWMSRIDRVFATGESLRVEDTMPVADRWVHSQSVLSPIRDPDGRIFAVGVVYRDITEQKQTEADLRESEGRFRLMFQNAGEGILIVDLETRRFSYANPKICQMLGYACEELLGLSVPDIHPKEALDRVVEAFEIIINGGKASYELPCLRKDGGVIYVRINGAAIDISGKQWVYGFFTDITEQNNLRQKLTENERLYREIYNRARIPLYRTRIHDGKLLECNETMVQFLGYSSKDECLREHYSTMYYADPAKRAECLALLEKDGFVDGFEIEFIRRDGIHVWVELSAHIYPQEGYIEGTHIDITPRKILTPMEKAILALILQNNSNKETAKTLHRSIRTVEDHRARIMKKLNVDSFVGLMQKTRFFLP
jgi:PAS domain S-box-containing protein